jgi:Putative zinc-finger
VTIRMLWRKLNAPRDHRWAMPRFSRFLEDDLPPRQKRRLEEHRSICPECRRALESLKKLLAALPRLRDDEAGHRARVDRALRGVMEQIQHEPPPAP